VDGSRQEDKSLPAIAPLKARPESKRARPRRLIASSLILEVAEDYAGPRTRAIGTSPHRSQAVLARSLRGAYDHIRVPINMNSPRASTTGGLPCQHQIATSFRYDCGGCHDSC
jgi:hypothetical protein